MNMWLYSENNFFVFRSIIEQVADHVMVTDRNGHIEYVNPAFEKTTGYSKEEVIGKNPKILQSGKQPLEYYQELWRTILAGNVFCSRTINKKKNGELYVADQTVSPIINEFKEIRHFVSIWKDITDIVRIEERLKFEKDKLEEIIGFDEQLARFRKSDHLIDFVVGKTRKILNVEKCSVMLFDKETKQLYTKSMEGFPEDVPMQINIIGSTVEKVILDGQPLLVNDLEGDALLKEISMMIYLNLREVDVLCRYGGDEFVIILPGTDKEGAILVAEKIRKCIENAKFQKSVTLSIGIAQHKDRMTRQDLTNKADNALYQAKGQGKNRVCVFGQD